MAVGVFDGVGGWADSGVNPREYSYKLMEGCKKAAEEVVISAKFIHFIDSFSFQEPSGYFKSW